MDSEKHIQLSLLIVLLDEATFITLFVDFEKPPEARKESEVRGG